MSVHSAQGVYWFNNLL